MKYFLTVLFFCTSCNIIFAQPEYCDDSPSFQRYYNIPLNAFIKFDSEGNLWTTRPRSFFKLDTELNKLVAKRFNIQGSDPFPTAWTSYSVPTNDNGLIFTAMYSNPSQEDSIKILVSKYSTTGTPEWSKFFVSTSFYPIQFTMHIKQLANGNYFLRCHSNDNDGLGLIHFLMDEDGSLIWKNKFGIDENLSTFRTEIELFNDGSILIYGNKSDDTFSESNPFLMKIAADGSILWYKKLPLLASSVQACVSSNDDIFLLIAESTTIINSNENISICKISSQGDLIWLKDYYSESDDTFLTANNIFNTSTNELIVAFSSFKDDSQSNIMKLDIDGEIIWSYDYGQPDIHDRIITSAISSNDEILLSCFPIDFDVFVDFYIVKTCPNGFAHGCTIRDFPMNSEFTNASLENLSTISQNVDINDYPVSINLNPTYEIHYNNYCTSGIDLKVENVSISCDPEAISFDLCNQSDTTLLTTIPYGIYNANPFNQSAESLIQDSTSINLLPFQCTNIIVDQEFDLTDQVFVVVGDDGSKSTPLSFSDFPIIDQDEISYENNYAAGNLIIPILELPADTIINLGQSITIIPINISENVSIEWTTEDGDLIESSDQIILVNPFETTTYSLTVSDDLGCTNSDQITVIINLEPQLDIPNAFTPNRDGISDEFRLVSPEGLNYQVNKFVIFNRWGETILSLSNLNSNEVSWDGTISNKKAPSDVYFFHLEFENANGFIYSKSGDITLIR